MNPELAQYEALAKETLRRTMAEEEPSDIHEWLVAQLARMGGGDETAVLEWLPSFDYTDTMLAEFERLAHMPPEERCVLEWPWESWRSKIDTLEPGMLAVVSAADGMGKTIYAESIAEHWAMRRNKVVFVHFELNRKLMMLRRLARHTRITYRDLKSGMLTPEQKRAVSAMRPRLTAWDGCISYVHTPGWAMERTTAELRKLHADGLCQVVVLDYLEKAAPSRKQLQMFGSNAFQREADNVEQLKTFAESTEIPVLMVAQMNKAGKGREFKDMDRTGMRGAGEKSERANLVMLLHRDRQEDKDTGEIQYSNEVDVMIDKQTIGPTGSFKQMMVPEFFSVGDPA